jgi:hypothetical protein
VIGVFMALLWFGLTYGFPTLYPTIGKKLLVSAIFGLIFGITQFLGVRRRNRKRQQAANAGAHEDQHWTERSSFSHE